MKCSTICGNCEPDNDEYITVEVLKDVDLQKEADIEDSAKEEHETDSNNSIPLSPSSIDSISPVIPEEPTLEMCSIVYFAGYLVNKCLEKYSCEKCLTSLINPSKNLKDINQILILYKTYNFVGPTQGLKAPSNLIVKITKICLDVFQEWFNKIKSECQILKQLIEKVKTKINKTWPNIFNSTSPTSSCQAHYHYIIELLLRTKIFKQCKSDNFEIHGKRQVQNVAKLRVLQHN